MVPIIDVIDDKTLEYYHGNGNYFQVFKDKTYIVNLNQNDNKGLFINDVITFGGYPDPPPSVKIRIARLRHALWRAILRRATLSTSFIRIARPNYSVFFLWV